MSRELIYLSIILKKQPYGEGDELITVFTREAGKVRGLAKSVKLPKSKLQYGLQVLFLAKLTLTQSPLPKIIGTEVVETFAHIRDSLPAANMAFYALELVLKFTPDEQKNEMLFSLLADYFRFLDAAAADESKLNMGLVKFKTTFLDALGYSIHSDPAGEIVEPISFSNHQGGFLFGRASADSRELDRATFDIFTELSKISFAELMHRESINQEISELQEILSGFVRYHLEREVRSERFL